MSFSVDTFGYVAFNKNPHRLKLAISVRVVMDSKTTNLTVLHHLKFFFAHYALIRFPNCFGGDFYHDTRPCCFSAQTVLKFSGARGKVTLQQEVNCLKITGCQKALKRNGTRRFWHSFTRCTKHRVRT